MPLRSSAALALCRFGADAASAPMPYWFGAVLLTAVPFWCRAALAASGFSGVLLQRSDAWCPCHFDAVPLWCRRGSILCR